MKYIIDVPEQLCDLDKTIRIPITINGYDTWITTNIGLKSYTEPDCKTIEDEVWEFARMVRRMNISDWIECFEQNTLAGIFDLDYSEAKAKHDAWSKQNIREGDEVIYKEPCEDTVPRTSVEYICRKNTVSTNPYEHKYYDKFIQFMHDPEISDFGLWQHSNGFNAALVAVKCDLDKVPSFTPKAEPKTGK